MAAATRLIEMARGYQLSQALFVAAQLGIADLLADGPLHITAIAQATDTNATALHRLLRVLASRGLLAEVGDQTFALTTFGTLLRRDVPGSAHAQVLLWGHPMQWDSWSALLHSVRTGETAFESKFGVNHWEYLVRNPEAGDMFKAAMAAHPCHTEVPRLYDFKQFESVVDVGGGKGRLLLEILQACPATRGILLDRPEVVQAATQAFAAAGLSARCQIIGGDFFDDLPTGADAYILSNVLMDWDDAAAIRLLRQCRMAMPHGGTLLVVERIIESDNRPSLSQLGDLMGLVVTGGRVRAESELDALFTNAGLRRTRSLRTDSGFTAFSKQPYAETSVLDRHLCRNMRAFSQSRCTVRSDMFHMAAISAKEKPPKYLRSTTSASRESVAASRSTASLRRCSSLESATCSGISVGSEVISKPAPRFKAWRLRA